MFLRPKAHASNSNLNTHTCAHTHTHRPLQINMYMEQQCDWICLLLSSLNSFIEKLNLKKQVCNFIVLPVTHREETHLTTAAERQSYWAAERIHGDSGRRPEMGKRFTRRTLDTLVLLSDVLFAGRRRILQGNTSNPCFWFLTHNT